MDVAIPKLRSGWCFPGWLLERRRRAERALTTVVATCYLLGVLTRRMDELVEPLGITRLSKLQVSEVARDLTARGFTGVALVTSDAQASLVAAIGARLPAPAGKR